MDLSVCLLPPCRADRIERALPEGQRLERARTATDLAATLRRSSGVVFLDPLLLATSGHAGPEELDTMLASRPVVVYTELTSVAVHALLAAKPLREAPLLIAGVDDGPDAIRKLLHAIGSRTHQVRALEDLRSRAGPLPRPVQTALGRLGGKEAGELTVQGLARSAHMSVRNLERLLSIAGAPPARWLVRTARALLAKQLLRESRLTVEAVAHRVGYAKVGSLRSLLRWSFNASPSAVRASSAPSAGPHWRRRASRHVGAAGLSQQCDSSRFRSGAAAGILDGGSS